MNEKFKTLLSLLELRDIRIIDSHESVLGNPIYEKNTQINIKTEQFLASDYPKIVNENNNKILVSKVKYIYSFEKDEEIFFKCEYVVVVSFECKDTKAALSLLDDEDVKKYFYDKQINRTLWSIFRGVITDACTKHSLQPIVLPWIK